MVTQRDGTVNGAPTFTGKRPKRRLAPRPPADYDSQIDGRPRGHKDDRGQPTRQLPHDLVPGGAADRALEAAAGNAGVDGVLLRAVRKDLESLRRYVDQIGSSTSESAKTMMDQYKRGLQQSSADPVLRWCLARRAGLDEVAETIKDRARQKLEAKAEGYAIVLRDLLPEDVRQSLESELYVHNLSQTAACDWATFERRMEVQRREPAQGLLTGFTAFDQATGGLNYVTLLGGPTGAGKTTLALNFATGVLRRNKHAGVVVFNLEFPKQRYYAKLLSLESGVDYTTLMANDWPSEVEDALNAARERLAADILPRLHVADCIGDTPGKTTRFAAMDDMIFRFWNAARVDKILVVVDRVQQLHVMDEDQTQ
jgi:hypothetical protein